MKNNSSEKLLTKRMISVLKNLIVGFENPSSHLPAVAWLCQVTTIIRPLAYKIYKGRRPYNNCHGSGHPVARRERLRVLSMILTTHSLVSPLFNLYYCMTFAVSIKQKVDEQKEQPLFRQYMIKLWKRPL